MTDLYAELGFKYTASLFGTAGLQFTVEVGWGHGMLSWGSVKLD